MATQILRPVFSENQILSSSDVNRIVNYARDARARHNRYQHAWGIVHGLELTAEDRTDDTGDYKEVSIQPGMLIDGHGREVLVSEAVRLSEDIFDQLNIEQSGSDIKYPVFISARDEEVTESATSIAPCSLGATSRISEKFDITFGRVGSELDLDKQTTLPVSDGVNRAGTWLVLIGYVGWENKRFDNIFTESNGIGLRYAGVQADDVAGVNDRLVLRSAEKTIEDKAALIIDNQNNGEMRFGIQDNLGNIVPVFTVNAKGDVNAEGKITGAIAGGVQIESGIISDGALVPLPPGITQAQLDSGEATAHIQLSPRFQNANGLPTVPANVLWQMTVLECYAEGRRVNCRVRWIRTDGLGALTLPGTCDFQISTFVKAEGGI